MATTEHLKNGTGSQATTFSFTFPYIKQADIIVQVYESSAWVTKDVTTHYTFPTATSVQFVTGEVPDSGTNNIKIYRNTDTAGLAATFYPGSAIRSSDLNDNFTQNLYVTQEAENDAATAITDSATAVTTADAAVVTADAADATADTAKDTADDAADDVKRWIKDGDGTDTVGDEDDEDFAERPLKPQGIPYAVAQAATAVTTANTASTNASAAVTTANTADDNADDALRATDRLVATTSNDGSTWTLTGNNTNASTDPKGVGYAVTQAETAVTTANTATTTANTANDTADDALRATDRLVATTTDDGSTWTLAGNNTNASTDPKGVGYAITQAEAAVTTADTADTNASAAVVTANAASAAVSDAVLFTLKADKTAFEATTFSEDGYFEITDSTGISDSYTSFTDGGSTSMTISGIPSAPTFDDGIASRFTYDHSATTFTWLGYWVTDSETRYVDQADTAANLPAGTTAQRPGTPAAGMFRYNTTESEFEGYDGSEWGEVGGGIVTLDGGNFDNGTSLVNTTEIYDGGDFDS